MKKLFAVVMVIVVLFNAGGYELFFQYLVYRSDSRIIEKINHNRYRSSDLVEVKIPVDIPAQAPQEYSADYVPIAGQIQVKNNKYDYAEIRITHDTLYLRVVPNMELTKLVKASGLYAKLVNDLPASNTKHPVNPLTKKSLSESEYLAFNYNPTTGVKVKKVSHSFAFPHILKPALESGGQPPEV